MPTLYAELGLERLIAAGAAEPLDGGFFQGGPVPYGDNLILTNPTGKRNALEPC